MAKLWLNFFASGGASLTSLVLNLFGLGFFAIADAVDPTALWGRVLFTLSAVPQALLLLAQLVTAVWLLFDANPRNNRTFRARVIADVYVSFWLVWGALLMLFWTWDLSADRDRFLGDLGAVGPFHAYLVHLYLSATLFNGVGFGRYAALHLGLETLITVQVVVAGLFLALIMSAAVSIAVENAVGRKAGTHSQ